MWLIIVSVESLIAALLTHLRKSSAYISAKWYRSWRERRSSKTCDCPSVSSRSPWQLPALFFFFFVNSWKALNFPQVAPPPPDKFARSHAIVESDALVQRVPRNRNNRPRGNQALWYLFNLVVFLNYHWLPLLSLTQFEFSVPVVAFDFRICLGAYFVCLSCSLNI